MLPPAPPKSSVKFSGRSDSDRSSKSMLSLRDGENRYKPYKKGDGGDRKKKRGQDELDPMDPSSYSDVPRLVQLQSKNIHLHITCRV